MPTILIQTDPSTLVQKVVTETQRNAWARDFTIYDILADGTRGPAYGPTMGQGFLGACSPDNFGVNSIRYPLNWDDVTTGPATRTGVADQLAQATQRGNWVRIFFGLNSNGKGGSGAGSATGSFRTGTLEHIKCSGALSGYQTNGAIADNATTIAVDTGTATIPVGTHIQFDNYFVYTTTTSPLTGAGNLTVTPAVRGGIADNTPMRYAIVGGLYQTNGAVARLATTITLDSGAGPIPVGTEVEFDNSEYVYTVTAGITAPGTITVTPPVQQAIADDTPMRTNSRLNELRYAIDVCHAAGLKVLLALEGYVPITDADMVIYRDQMDTLLRTLPRGGNRQATLIDAFEPSNEVYQQQTDHGVTLPRIAEMMRVTATLFRAYSPRTVVLSCSYQGGESMGDNLVQQMMAASAAGITCMGSTGAGTTGEQWFDAVAYHPYIETLSTIASATAALTSSAAQLRFKDFIDPIFRAFSARRAAKPSYWAGRENPEVWASEYNVNPNGGVATTNSAFRMQYFTPDERGLLTEQPVTALLACGCVRVFPYAVDHQYVQGPIGQLTLSAAPNGDLRVDTTSAGGTAILDGDAIFMSNFGYWCVAYNANEAGTIADFKGVAAGTYSPYQATAYRWQLGGWADSYLKIQSKLIGYLDASWHVTSDVPQVTVGGGPTLLTTAGVLVDSSA